MQRGWILILGVWTWGCKAVPDVEKMATPKAKPGCEMLETRTQLPAQWKIVEGPPTVHVQCDSQTIVLDATPKEAKAGLLTCPPDDSSSALPVGPPGDFVAYRKFRSGDGIVELGIVKVEGQMLEGLARIDRMAPGKAIESNYLGEFKLTVAEFNEVIDALLHTKLVAFEPKTKSAQIRGTFENRCRNWDAPAQGAAALTLQQALQFPHLTPSASATPSTSPPSVQPPATRQ